MARSVPSPSAPERALTLGEQSARNASTVAYQYDAGGNRVEVKLDGTVFVTYGYDDASRLTTITRGTNVFGFAYDNANRRTTMTYPNGVDTSYTYDNLNRLTNLAATHVPTSTPITNFGYQYDAAGNRTQKSTLDYTEDYGYDPLYRLTRTDRTNPGATPPNQWTWNYDAVGNRTSAQKDSEATTSSYNEKNQLTGATGGGKMLWRGTLDEPGIATFSAPTINGQPARMLAGNVFEATLDLPAGANSVTIQAQDGSGNIATKVYSVNVIGVPSSYTYDANGSLTQKVDGADTWVYTWNALNQLTTVMKNMATVASYSYDPMGRRVEKIAGAAVTGWAYDDEDILREQVVLSGVVTSATFIHGPGVDAPLGREESSGTRTFLHGDLFGSIVRHTDSNGSVVLVREYDPWGKPGAGSNADGYAFTGREWDVTIGLYYYRARYYDASVGHFISSDPVGLKGGLNFYRYAEANPTNLVDPSGLCPDCNVEIRCRPLHFPAAETASKWTFGIVSPLHCYVVGTDGGGSQTTFTAGKATSGSKHLGAWALPGFPARNSEDSPDDPIVFRKRMDCDVLNCLKENTEWFHNQQYTYDPVRGPNSNSVAFGLASSCKFPAQAPFWAWGGNYFQQ